MPSEPGKFIRFCIDLDEREYQRLHLAAQRKGCTKAHIVRETLERRLKDVAGPTRDARADLYKAH